MDTLTIRSPPLCVTDERIIEAFDDGVLWTSLGQAPHLADELAKCMTR